MFNSLLQSIANPSPFSGRSLSRDPVPSPQPPPRPTEDESSLPEPDTTPMQVNDVVVPEPEPEMRAEVEQEVEKHIIVEEAHKSVAEVVGAEAGPAVEEEPFVVPSGPEVIVPSVEAEPVLPEVEPVHINAMDVSNEVTMASSSVESSTNIVPLRARTSSTGLSNSLPPSNRTSLPLTLGTLQRFPTSSHAAPKATGSLLSAGVPDQLHALQIRHAQAASSLAAEKAARASEMRRAQIRIDQLEKSLNGAKIECEGWEAEALRLIQEKNELEEKSELEWVRKDVVIALEAELEEEKKRKRKWREREARGRLELVARRWKEKWELGIMDVEDRKRDGSMVELEYDLALARLRIGLDAIDKEELQDTVSRQQKRILLLEGSRSVLLELSNTAETAISSLRVELSTSRKSLADFKKEFNSVQSQLADEKERVTELEQELESAKKGEKKSESKEVSELKKTLEKEKLRKNKLESDLTEAKASLKIAQAESREAQRTAQAATQAAELARISLGALSKAGAVAPAAKSGASKKAKGKAAEVVPDVAALAAKKRKSLSMDGSDPVEVMGVDDEEEEEEEAVEEQDQDDLEADASIELLKAEAATRAANTASSKARKAVPPLPFAGIRRREPTPVLRDNGPPSPLSVISDAGEENDSYKPVKSKSRAGPAPSRANALGGLSFGAAAKRKVSSMLGDKSTNAKSDKSKSLVEGEVSLVKKVSKKISVGSTIAETEAETTEEGDGPTKKKKRKLFGGAKKFEWGAVENADVNSLGIPSLLSPLKKTSALDGRTSIGILGRGMGGRPNIFG